MNAALVEAFVKELAKELAPELVKLLRGEEQGMVDQSASPLGRRRHCSATKRRLARGEHGASIVGRRHLLSHEALSEELARASGKAAPVSPVSIPAAGGIRAELERELSQLRVVR